MNDAAPWFALILAAVTGWGYAFAQAMETKRLRDDVTDLMEANSEILSDVGMLESLLKQARKNDSRDAKGRYVSAEAICTEPQGYVGKAIMASRGSVTATPDGAATKRAAI